MLAAVVPHYASSTVAAADPGEIVLLLASGTASTQPLATLAL